MNYKIKEKILKFWRALVSEGSFVQNFAIVFAGSFLATVVQFFLTPIITRLFPPESYGTFSLFAAVASNLALLATLMYDKALLLPKREDHFIHQLQLCLILVFTFSLSLSLLIFVGGEYLMKWFRLESLSNWIYALGPAVLLIALTKILVEWNARLKRFKKRSFVEVSSNLGARVFHIIFGTLKGGAFYGLIVGEYLSKLYALVVLAHDIWKEKNFPALGNMQWQNLKAAAKKYVNYPLYFLPGSWINLFSEQLPIFMFTYFFDPNIVGLYAMATGLMTVPIRLLGNSIYPVFFQKAVETYNSNPQKVGTITFQIFRQLLLLAVVPFLIIMFYGDDIFRFILGSNWEMAGTFSSILSLFYLFKLVSSPLSSIFSIYGKEKSLLKFQVLLFILRFASLAIGIYFFRSPIETLLMFSIANASAYLILSLQIFKIISISRLKVLLLTFVIIIPVFIILLIINGFWSF